MNWYGPQVWQQIEVLMGLNEEPRSTDEGCWPIELNGDEDNYSIKFGFGKKVMLFGDFGAAFQDIMADAVKYRCTTEFEMYEFTDATVCSQWRSALPDVYDGDIDCDVKLIQKGKFLIVTEIIQRS